MGHNTFGNHFSRQPSASRTDRLSASSSTGSKAASPSTLKRFKRDGPPPSGGNPSGTERNEIDKLVILSGLYEGVTTGTPIAMILESTNQRPRDYSHLKDVFRPGHADWTFYKKYGVRDIRGGGRSSGRETSARVAAGALAKQLLAKRGITIRAGVVQVGDIVAMKRDWEDPDPILACPDREAAASMVRLIETVRKENDSIGGVIECIVRGLPSVSVNRCSENWMRFSPTRSFQSER